ncbi:MAG: pyrroline-5-carboxylate reductase [Flavobacteriaceae bacterium]|nr:pyrroline-5-carboxylate reductase [Bacteroidia bacterium]NNF75476.1 pyrroline-5-carboxylate reductase [Flavobacteriaceae bacterium]
MKIAIIGTGNLGRQIAKGLILNNAITTLYLTRRNLEEIQDFKGYANVKLTRSNKKAVKASDILIFAVQPGQLSEILTEVSRLLTEKHVIISTVTGFDTDRIAAIIGEKQYIIRAMPNTAIGVGKSMTCLCCNENGEKRIKIAEAIFNRLGKSIVIDEEDMQAATVICASGIAFWMRLIRATSQAAIQLGFEANKAQELATHTCEGAASLLIASGHHPEYEIDKVTTPKGCTIQGLNAMEHLGLSSALIKGMVTSFEKIDRLKTDQL